ncbi:MAG: ACT domain-containing protein [Lysobacterales bacterium]|jgi:acetolactate synthase regulatory subunit
MEYTLHIQLRDCFGATIRALGMMERRGYRLKTCSLGEPDGTSRELAVTVMSTRPGDLLKRQLERLHDVLLVELKSAEPIVQKNAGVRPVVRRV